MCAGGLRALRLTLLDRDSEGVPLNPETDFKAAEIRSVNWSSVLTKDRVYQLRQDIATEDEALDVA